MTVSQRFRKQPTDRGRTTLPYIQTVRDGYRDMSVEIDCDNRVTGLREHRQYRRRTRAMLKHGEYGSVLVGKKRRYGDRYGEYEW